MIAERLSVRIESYEAGYEHANLNTIASPVQDLRLAFDLMERETTENWATVATRMAAVPAALAGYQESLLAGAQGGVTPAVRQVDECAIQAATYGGARDQDGYFAGLAASYPAHATCAGPGSGVGRSGGGRRIHRPGGVPDLAAAAARPDRGRRR